MDDGPQVSNENPFTDTERSLVAAQVAGRRSLFVRTSASRTAQVAVREAEVVDRGPRCVALATAMRQNLQLAGEFLVLGE